MRAPGPCARAEGHEGVFRIDTGVPRDTLTLDCEAVRELRLVAPTGYGKAERLRESRAMERGRAPARSGPDRAPGPAPLAARVGAEGRGGSGGKSRTGTEPRSVFRGAARSDVPRGPVQLFPLLQALLATLGGSGAPGCWDVEATLVASPSTRLGLSVALAGDTVVVAEEGAGTGARVYVRDDEGWVLQQQLLPSVALVETTYARAVALEGDVAVLTSARGTGTRGSAYVFRRSGGRWSEEAQLLPVGVNTSGALFGTSVALDGERLAIGAPGREWVFTYERQGTSWIQTDRIKVVSFESPGALALSGDTLAVCGLTTTFPQIVDVAVHVYRWDGANWLLEQILPSPDPDVLFATSVALEGERLAVGCPSATSAPDADAVFLYARVAGVWSLDACVAPPPGEGRYHDFGTSVALDGERLAVGAPDAPLGLEERGRVFLYGREGGAWSLEVSAGPHAAPPGASTIPRFGWSVSLEGATLVAGDPRWPAPSPSLGGAAFVLTSDPSHAPGVGFRNAGTNPVSYAAGAARLGETLELVVAPARSGHAQALVLGFDAPAALALGGGQTLLCQDDGSGALLATGFRPGPFATFHVAVPDALTLLGARLYTQAVHAFGAPGFALSNAQDLCIGASSVSCP